MGLTVALNSGVSEALTCSQLFTTGFQRAESSVPQARPQFEQSAFSRIKTDLKSKIEANEDLRSANFDNDWSKLALFEVIAEKSGWDLLNISKIMAKGSGRDQQRVTKILNQFSFDDGVSARKLESILTRLYLLANSHPKGIDLSISTARERLITKRMELSFVKQSFMEALHELGFIRDPNLFERVKALRSQYSNYESLLITASLNAFSITHFGIPVHVPKLQAGERQNIPPEVIQKIKDHGIDAARDDLKRIYSRHSNFQLAWNTVRRLYTGAMFGLAVFMSVQMLPMLEYSIASHFTTEQRLAEIQNATFSADKVREEQFNSWRQAFNDLEGRYPDTAKYPQDAAEWNRVSNSLAQIPDEQLRVQFNEGGAPARN